MYLCLILCPLLASLATGLFGRFLGRRGAVLITTSLVAICFLLSVVAFIEVGLGASPCFLSVSEWFFSDLFDASWGFIFDSLTVVICVIVTSVSILVHLYSISYIHEDPHLPRFISYLSIFTFFILLLVAGDNFVVLFLGWEGVGLASFLLISFWFQRLQAGKAAVKAILINRVGDFGLALGVFAIFALFGTFDYSTVFALTPIYVNHIFIFCGIEVHALSLIAILLFIGAVGKSAQLGLHTWLPDAMEGPTPVSALIHAATMVTAGVFLIARCSPLLEYAPKVLVIIAVLGAITSFVAATTGVFQNDLKRVIAYSTCSQLGYMVFACGLSAYPVGIFHLANHAFFKALLFLSAGSVIHALGDEQDIRRIGGLTKALPFTYGMILIGSLALIGWPFLTGFYSKDIILELAFAKYTISGNFALFFGLSCVFLTSFYTTRQVVITFFSKPNRKYGILHEADYLIGIVFVILAFGSIFVGFLGKDLFIGIGTSFWNNAVFVHPSNGFLLEAEYIPQTAKIIPLILTASGIIIACLVVLKWQAFIYRLCLTKTGKAIVLFFNKRWLFDKVYNDFLSKPALSFGYNLSFKTIDKGILEVFGPLGIQITFKKLCKQVSNFHSGYMYHYALIFLVSVTILLLITGGDARLFVLFPILVISSLL